MKICPKCNVEFPDKYRFCLHDGTTLADVAESQPAVTIASEAFTPNYYSPAAQGAEYDSDETTIVTTATPSQGARERFSCEECGTELVEHAQFCKKCGWPRQKWQGEANESSTGTWVGSTLTDTPAGSVPNKRLFIILAAAVVILIVGAGIGLVAYKMRTNPIETKLDEAIVKNNLLTPPGANAYELYHQLKLEGTDPATLSKFQDRLLPMLTPHPQQMLTEFAKAGSKEPSPAEWDEAGKLLAWASEIKPVDKTLAAKADYCKGRVAYLANRKDEAMDMWKQASELDNSWALPTNGVGLIYNERKEYATAREYLFEATRRSPDWAVPYNNLGTSYYFERDYDQAESYYNQAASRAPHWARPHAWLGDIAMHRQDYNRAVQEFQAVLAADATGTENIDLNKISQQLERARQSSGQSTESE